MKDKATANIIIQALVKQININDMEKALLKLKNTKEKRATEG